MSLYKDASLVMIPSAYKDGKLYSIRPTDGDGDFTFSRGSNLAATRVDVNGLIEKGRENLLLQSNQFDTTWGIAGAASVTGGQAGYDGTNNAWLLSKTSAWSNVSQSIANSGVKTFSVYAKANASDWGLLVLSTGATDPVAYFDLNNGVVGVNASNIDAVITPVSSGWYRISIVASQTINAVRIYPAEANTASGSSGSIYIQDAQLEQGLVATDYIETGASTAQAGILEDMPRLDYSGSCPALLLEPQRTNNIPYSEYQSGSGFSLGANITWNGFVESPEGVNNASRFTSITPSACFVQIQNVTIPAGDFTFSMWVRGVSGSFINRNMYIPSHTGTQATMNEAPVAGEDWKLVYGSGTNTSGSSYSRTITLPFYDQPAGSVWEMYGFQLEAGSYPTSYIPTYGSSVTRSTERQIGFSSLPTDIVDTSLAHTGFIEIKANEIASSTYQVFGFDDGSYANYIKLYASNTQKSFRLLALASGSGSATTGFSPDGGYSKFAWSYDGAGTIKIFMNGSLITTASITFPTMSVFGFGEKSYAINYTSINTKQIALFPTALTDSECIALTTI